MFNVNVDSVISPNIHKSCKFYKPECVSALRLPILFYHSSLY